MSTTKKIPMRKCVGCQEMKNKKEMLRVLKTAEGEFILDATGRKNGRGAYLCFSGKCLQEAIKNKGLERSFKQAIPKEIYENLEKELEQLTNALGLGAKGKGAQAATRGSAGVIKELEENQKRRRKREEFDLVDIALMDMVGLLRDALMVASGVDVDGGSGNGGVGGGSSASGGAGGGSAAGDDAAEVGPALINPDRCRTSLELARRVSPEGLVTCIDAVMDAREAMGRNVRPAVALDGLMGTLQLACGVGQR